MQDQRVFSYIKDILRPFPDVSNHRDIFTNIKTAICGKKTTCELGDKDCIVRCNIVKKAILWLILVFLFSVSQAFAYTDNEIANAIYQAEGINSKYPYGIKSIETNGDTAYARQICLNTIRNHRKRHAEHNCGLDFITCLGNRYCPPNAHPLNKNWVKNVKYFLDNIFRKRKAVMFHYG